LRLSMCTAGKSLPSVTGCTPIESFATSCERGSFRQGLEAKTRLLYWPWLWFLKASLIGARSAFSVEFLFSWLASLWQRQAPPPLQVLLVETLQNGATNRIHGEVRKLSRPDSHVRERVMVRGNHYNLSCGYSSSRWLQIPGSLEASDVHRNTTSGRRRWIEQSRARGSDD
jgi:hypothetical protein